MNTRTWNVTLMATDEHPETTIEGVSHADAAKILRGLMYGPKTLEYGHVKAAVAQAPVDHHESSLAA